MNKRAFLGFPALLAAAAVVMTVAAPAGAAVKLQATMTGTATSPQATGQVRYESRTATDKRFELRVQNLALQPQQVEPDPVLRVTIDGQSVGTAVEKKGQIELKTQGAGVPDAHAGSVVEVSTTGPVGALSAGTAVARGTL